MRTPTLVVVAMVLLNSGALAAATDGQPSVARAVGGLFVPDSPLLVAEDPTVAAPPMLQGIQPATPPVLPQSTGFRSLLKDSGRDFIAFPKRRSTWVFLSVGAGAAALAHPADPRVNAHLAGPRARNWFIAGKYIGSTYAQVGVALGLYAIGRFVVPAVEGGPKSNKWSHVGFDLLRAQILSQGMVHAIKLSVRRDRPTGECCAFPSGHAASAFAAAAVVERHLGYRFAWPAILAASYVATSRLRDNRHYLSDVVFGSALGTATGWTVVGRHGRNSYALMPVHVPGGVALTFARVAPVPSGVRAHAGS
jgi:membrane-associated phospholipid phosphatase